MVTGINVENFNAIMRDEYGVVTNLDVARFLGCGEGTISRIRSGEQIRMGGSFIACVALHVSHAEFFQVFTFGARAAA